MGKVHSGLDVLLGDQLSRLRGLRVGVLCHQASVDSRLRHIVPSLLERKVQITALFAPEHGLWGTAQDQVPIQDEMPHPHPLSLQERGGSNTSLSRRERVAEGRVRQIPTFSLYGNHRAPSPEQLASLDVLVCDLQDVGSRYYTFVWTMALAMQACAKAGKRFIVLDRPNPVNGETLEGPLLDMNFASFVGLYPVPVRHGLTAGELALWLNARFDLGVNLEVVAMKGWQRSMNFEETGLPWVLPSPNMPTPETAWVYPGGCLIEGTNLSEGRGTTRPFELIGAPYIDGDTLAQVMNAADLPGVSFRACRFEPTFHKFKGQLCGGVQVHITDRQTFRSFFTYLTMIQFIRELYPKHFAWRMPPYEYEAHKLPFDILCGTDTIRFRIESGQSLRTLENSWLREQKAFREECRSFLLYNRS